MKVAGSRVDVERAGRFAAIAAPIFCGFAEIRLARRSRIFGTPAGESAFSGPVSLRRFFFFLLAVVAVAGLTWGAALKLTRPAGSADDHGPRRFDLAVAEAKALRVSLFLPVRMTQN